MAHEFDSDFAFIAEHRGHVAEWVGDKAYYQWFRSMPFRCPLVPGDEF